MTSGRRRRTTKNAGRAMTMADYAMSFERLGLWISERARSATPDPHRATSLSMVDGAVAAVVAGPVSTMPDEWVCPLLGVDPDDFNHDTETFSAIAATLMRHNAISETLSTNPAGFEPLFSRGPDDEIDARPWCMGFYATMKTRLSAWSPLLNPAATEHRLLAPILFHCTDGDGRPVLDPERRGSSTQPQVKDTWREIPTIVEAMRQFWMPTRFARDA